MTDIVEVVNFIRSRGLNHREFKAYLDEVEVNMKTLYMSPKSDGSVEQQP